jgi:hypothetical protein
MTQLPPGFAPIAPGTVVARALSMRGLGHYWRGGGAHFTDPSVFGPLGNPHPSHCDCTGLLAWAGMYARGPWNTDAIVADGLSTHRRFRHVPHDEPVQPGDFIVTGNGEGADDHAGVVVAIVANPRRAPTPRWWEDYSIAHCAGRSWSSPIPEEHRQDTTGAVRVTNAYRWRHTGRFFRPRHYTTEAPAAGAGDGASTSSSSGASNPVPGNPKAMTPFGPGASYVVKRGYSADHRAVDLTNEPGQALAFSVFAPEDGEVWLAANRAQLAEEDLARMGVDGQGPAFVLLRGDSGNFHIIGHLANVARTAGLTLYDSTHGSLVNIALGPVYRVAAGDVIGQVSNADAPTEQPWLHWEVSHGPPGEVQPTAHSGFVSAKDNHYLVGRVQTHPIDGWLATMSGSGAEGDPFTVHPTKKPQPNEGVGFLFLAAGVYLVGHELHWW